MSERNTTNDAGPAIKDIFELSCSGDCCPEVELNKDGSMRIVDDPDMGDGPRIISFTHDQAQRLATILFGEYGLKMA